MRIGFVRRADRPRDDTGELARRDRRIADLEETIRQLKRRYAQLFVQLGDQRAENRRLAALVVNQRPLWAGRADAAGAELAKVVHTALWGFLTEQEAHLAAEVAVEWFLDEQAKAAAERVGG